MTTETRERIKAYKRMLPDLRERVIAVALLLAMSASMLGSASFAWITLSRAPEVMGMSTTVAANGNLEIALAQGSISDPLDPPEESAVGDSSAAEEQTIVGANATWGNLVNVSDPSYGISEIALRPALLSDYNRAEYPLNGAAYGGDGRVVSTNERYEYASYEKLAGTDKYYFAAGADASGDSLVNYGVRAITSVGYVNYSGNERLDTYATKTYELYSAAQEYYGKIVDNDKHDDVNVLDKQEGVTCISALEALVTVFAQDKINKMVGDGSDTSCSPHLWYLYQMLLRLEKVLTDEGIALLELVNWQAYVASGDDKIENKVPSVDALLAMTDAQLKDPSLGLSANTIDTIKSYKQDLADLRLCIKGGTKNGKKYNDLESYAMNCSNPKAPTVDYYWNDIANNVNILVDIDTATLAGVTLSQVSMTTALKLVGGGDVIIKGGLLLNIEKRLIDQDNRAEAEVKITVYNVPLYGTKTIPGTVYTEVGKKGTAPTYGKAYEDATKLESTAKGEATAKDTYGMALDVWLRTNYPDAVLTLEGAAKYSEEPANITLQEDGKETMYRLHTITVNDAEVDVYKKGDVWYYATNHSEVPAEDLGNQIPEEKFNKIVSGYEGENRVWEDWREMLDGGYIEQDATTQGAGSCFVFYADNPVQQEKIKEMLQAFNVAFVDQNGDTLGTAKLNLETAYANQGKVTVPLEMEAGTDYLDESGNSHIGITTMTQNEPLFITAIIYLNGSKLQNQNVLADGELQGQLNIQFGTNTVLSAPMNEELAAKARTITATVTVNGESITDGTIGGTEGLEYKADGYPTTITLNVDGEQPEKIRGFFVRVINDTQGTRCEEINFTPNGDGTWTGAYTQDENGEWTVPLKLTNPGMYAFDTLIVDGVQYTLHDGTVKKTQDEYYPSNRPKVHIKGLALASVSIEELPGTYMTADTTKTLKVTAVVDSVVEPKQVNAQFFSADKKKQYTAILSRVGNTNVWEGTASIASSGTYTLDFVAVDEYSLPAPSTGVYELYLGLTAHVSTPLTQDKWQFYYTGATQIEMEVRIYDDENNPIKDLSGVQLFYNNVQSPAGLKWEIGPYDGYYGGAIDILQPGELTFKKLELGQVGTIRDVNDDVPQFLAINLNTPSYKSGQAATSQTIIDGSNATITVNMNEAGTAQNVYAEILCPDGRTEYIPANETYGDVRTFTLPKTDGFYTLERVYLQTVYDKEWTNDAGEKEGKWYANTEKEPTGSKDPTFFILEAEDKPTTEVIATYNISFFYDENGDGKFENVDANGDKDYLDEGDFLEEKTRDFTIHLTGDPDAEDADKKPWGTLFQGYKHNDLKVIVTDYKGRAFNNVSGAMVLNYTTGSSVKYGSYTGTEGSVSVAAINVPMVLGSGGTYLTLKDKDTATEEFDSEKLIQSGEYIGKIVLNVAGKAIEVNVHPTFTVATKNPTVTISSVSTNPTTARYYLTTTPSSLNVISGSFNKKLDDYNAVVYMYVGEKTGTLDQEQVAIKYPTVTLNLAGVSSNHGGAQMVFPSGNNTSSTFTFAAKGTTATASIGAGSDGVFNEGLLGLGSGVDSWPVFYPAGMQEVDEIAVTHNNVSYTVTLSNAVTINNPLYPPYADFVIESSKFTGTVPDRIYSADAKTIVLPDIDNWTIYNEAIPLNQKSYPDPTTSAAGTYYYDRGWWRYYTYSRTMHTQSCTVESEVNNITYKLQWRVGNKTYEPGEEIEISGATTIRGVVTEASREFVINTAVTYTKTWYTYAQTGTSKSGTEIDFTPDASTKYDASNNVYNETEVTS